MTCTCSGVVPCLSTRCRQMLGRRGIHLSACVWSRLKGSVSSCKNSKLAPVYLTSLQTFKDMCGSVWAVCTNYCSQHSQSKHLPLFGVSPWWWLLWSACWKLGLSSVKLWHEQHNTTKDCKPESASKQGKVQQEHRNINLLIKLNLIRNY